MVCIYTSSSPLFNFKKQGTMRSILAIVKSPLIWRIMISITMFLLLRELKSVHKDIVLIPKCRTIFLTENQQPRLNNPSGAINAIAGNSSAISNLQFDPQGMVTAQVKDSVSWLPQTAKATAIKEDSLPVAVFRHHEESINSPGEQIRYSRNQTKRP